MKWFKKKEIREDPKKTNLEDLLLQAGLIADVVTRQMALNIPTLAGDIELVGNTIATLPIKLYKADGNEITEVENDPRISLLNDDTKDTLDGFQLKKALVADYLLMGNAYIYINKEKGAIKSLHYVKEENISINMNSDPIFKDYDILVNGKTYRPFEFVKILRNTRNGAEGQGIIEENPTILAVTYNSLQYENTMSKTGGNKKGFIKATQKLTEDAINLLKEQWNKMYKNNSENCIVLNNGLEFQESASTSTEMQLNETKITNGNEISKILNVPPSILSGDGKANEGDYDKFVKMAILPILEAITTAINRDLLLEKEKKEYYFAFDIKELLKGDIEKRYKAYEIGIKNGFIKTNEVRYIENYKAIPELENVIKLGLQDVLYNTETGEIYTPNTDKTTKMKGGE